LLVEEEKSRAYLDRLWDKKPIKGGLVAGEARKGKNA
jgi:hypothetical protein